MKFAINYSPQAAELVQEGVIDIDLFKCADWPELVEPAMKIKPAYIHFPLRAGGTLLPEPNWDSVKRWRDLTGTRFVNVHLGAKVEDYPDIPLTSTQPEHAMRVRDKMLRDLVPIISHFGAENVILENLPSQFSRRDEPQNLCIIVEPSLIRTVVEQSGCGLLLDIDHARVSALSLGMPYEDYIAQLPVDRLKELHMTGTRLYEGNWRSHFEMREEDWTIFDWALEQIKTAAWAHPDIFAFEYGGIGPKFDWKSDKALIARQVPEFRHRIRNAFAQ